MAPLKPVETLYELCRSCVLNKILCNICDENFDVLRKHLITVLPGTVRNNIIEKAMFEFCIRVPVMLNIIALLGDPSIKKIVTTCKESYIPWSQCERLFSVLNTSNIIGLHELDIKASGEMGGYSQSEVLSGLHDAFSRGLASSLRVLCLYSAADNHTLKLIGAHAIHLTHLEVTCSWLINDVGIADLLLKDSSNAITLPWPELEDRLPSAIETLSELPPSKLNRICETLCKVRIQDTNTSEISVALLLMFAKNLKSFGGFLYSRNMGDTVLSVQSRKNAACCLSLTELWDMDLPQMKLDKLVRSLPKLNSLYTRMACLPEQPGVLPPITHLTADFDFVHYGDQFYNFLKHYGRSIKKLLLIDQVYRLDLGMIAAYCPQLEELSAKVYIENFSEKSTTLLKNLKFAEVRVTSPQTFSWLMKQADNIKRLEVLVEHESASQDMFDITVLRDLVEENPKSLSSINDLRIHLSCRRVFGSVALSSGKLQIEAVELLCSACNSLRILGALETWLLVSEQDVLRMAEQIKNSNWDVKIVYRSDLYPSFCD